MQKNNTSPTEHCLLQQLIWLRESNIQWGGRDGYMNFMWLDSPNTTFVTVFRKANIAPIQNYICVYKFMQVKYDGAVRSGARIGLTKQELRWRIQFSVVDQFGWSWFSTYSLVFYLTIEHVQVFCKKDPTGIEIDYYSIVVIHYKYL